MQNASAGKNPPPNHPEPKKQGEGTRGKGNPNPEEKKTPLGQKKKKKRQNRLGEPRLGKGVPHEAELWHRELVLAESSWGQSPPIESTATSSTNNKTRKTRHSCLSCRPSHVVEKNVIVTMHPPPQKGPPKTKQNNDKHGPKFEGLKLPDKFPQSKDLNTNQNKEL